MSSKRTIVTRLGLQIPYFSYPGVPDNRMFERVAEIAATAEISGFDSLWVMDHFYQIAMIGPNTDPMLESYTLLGALAARTRKAKLGTMVTGVTYRNPALLAKIVTTLDIISSGRALLGIGGAWNDQEHRGYGFDFPTASERLGRLEEAVQICRAMFTEESPSFAGRYYHIDNALNYPRPVQVGGPPILIGGSGEQKTLRFVARYADACNLFGDLPTIRHKLDVLNAHCEEIGRDPDEITKTRLGTVVIGKTHEDAERMGVQARAARGMTEEWYRSLVTSGDPDEVGAQAQQYVDAGLDGLIFNMHRVDDLELVHLAGSTLRPIVNPGN